MKKLLFLLAAVFIVAVPTAAFADTFLSEDEIAALEANEDEIPYSVLLNNTGFVTFSAQQPINVNGRVYVPVRGVFEGLGYEVDFDVETKTAILTSSVHQIEITLGNEYFTVDGRYVYPETAQFI
ncbi:MAG: copper amine oxidase N-terminal domain-containing protein [Clostridiales bacterium]|nr:copper amine oxidase N-terminal domain-containing protein [Clostridiales bacterium]